MPDLIYIIFFFALGACIGSFLNVVVWRLPRGESLVKPPSHCPKCNHLLAWRDNLPVIGWILLRGKCRYCKASISPRYPIVELFTGLLFAGFYIAIFIEHQGPFWASYNNYDHLRAIVRMSDLAIDWPIFGLYLFTLAVLIAASLIDAELFIIPASLPWLMAGIGALVHTIVDRPKLPGALLPTPPAMALALGAAIGLLLSLLLLQLRIIPLSFAQGESELEVDKERRARELSSAKAEGREAAQEQFPEYTPAQIRGEIRKEMLFLLPPLLLGGISVILQTRVPYIHHLWDSAAGYDWIVGLLGSLLGGLIGAFVVWLTRILGSYLFGREAMGLGDVDLMFGVGAVLGPGPATVAFFIAPFFGMAVALYMFFTRTRRELPYGPYLSLATAFIMLFYFPIYDYLRPGLTGMGLLLQPLIAWAQSIV